MYQPKFSNSHKLVLELIKAETRIKSEASADLSTNIIKKLNQQSKAIHILHFAHMCGVEMSISDASKAAEGSQVTTGDARGQLISNLRSVLEYTRANASTSYNADIDANLLLHINRLLLAGWRETWDAKFRSAGDEKDTSLDNWGHLHDNTSPSRIYEEVTQLVEWFHANSAQITPLVRVGVLIERLIALAPFAVLNKLTIICIADNILHRLGYVDTSIGSITRNFDKFDQEYQEALQFGHDNDRDITLWLERFVQHLAEDVADTKLKTVRYLEQESESNQKPFLNLNKRQLKILKYLQTIPLVKREDYVQMMEVSTMTAYRDLNELVEKKLLRVSGKGRATKYNLFNR